MLRSTPNRFGGTEVETDALPSDPKQFSAQLYSAIDQWRTDQVKVAWVRIPTQKAFLIPVAVDARLATDPKTLRRRAPYFCPKRAMASRLRCISSRSISEPLLPFRLFPRALSMLW